MPMYYTCCQSPWGCVKSRPRDAAYYISIVVIESVEETGCPAAFACCANNGLRQGNRINILKTDKRELKTLNCCREVVRKDAEQGTAAMQHGGEHTSGTMERGWRVKTSCEDTQCIMVCDEREREREREGERERGRERESEGESGRKRGIASRVSKTMTLGYTKGDARHTIEVQLSR